MTSLWQLSLPKGNLGLYDGYWALLPIYSHYLETAVFYILLPRLYYAGKVGERGAHQCEFSTCVNQYPMLLSIQQYLSIQRRAE